MNIRTRLTLLFSLLVASIMVLFSLAIYYLYNQHRENEFQQRLEYKAVRATQPVREDESPVTGEPMEIVAGQVALYDESGGEIYRKVPGNPVFQLTSAVRQRLQEGGGRLRMRQDTLEAVALNFSRNNRSFIAVASGYDRIGFGKLYRLQKILFFGWLLSLLVVGVAGWLFSSDALRPVAALIEQAKTISATNIHQRLRVGNERDELAQLALTFNEMLQRLEEAFVNQKNFVSHASHELRTPLAVMMSQIDVALLQKRTTAEYEASLGELLETVKSMIRLVNSLIELNRVNAAGGVPALQPIRVDELLWQARSELLTRFPAYQIEIDFDNMPDQEDDLVVLGNESQLLTAFQNLMENGCKFSPDNAVSIRLAFRPGHMRIAFADRGVGIPATDILHIFEPFYRAENVLAVKGNGLGLALTQRIVELHQGRIQAGSVEGKGTEMVVTLPLPASATDRVAPTLEEAA